MVRPEKSGREGASFGMTKANGVCSWGRFGTFIGSVKINGCSRERNDFLFRDLLFTMVYFVKWARYHVRTSVIE